MIFKSTSDSSMIEWIDFAWFKNATSVGRAHRFELCDALLPWKIFLDILSRLFMLHTVFASLVKSAYLCSQTLRKVAYRVIVLSYFLVLSEIRQSSICCSELKIALILP